MIRDLIWIVNSLLIKWRYKRTQCRLKSKYGKEKLKVAFLVSEVAKWKGQSLYDLMDSSDIFEPLILVYPMSVEMQDDVIEQKEVISRKVLFFKQHHMDVHNIWDFERKKIANIEQLGIDIVFYQQQWNIPSQLSPGKVAKYALSFYFPYYLVNYFNIGFETGAKLHHEVFRYILFNDQLVQMYKQSIKSLCYAGEMIGLGHPIVDGFYLGKKKIFPHKYIIYAPHFSFPISGRERILSYSTFLDNGILLLEYAKKHSNLNWVFKPHPRLRRELVEREIWTQEEVDNYYAEWEKIGKTCYTSDYIDLFLESRVMITDCGSFLTEYSCTGQPLIHLVPKHFPYKANPVLGGLYDTFYTSSDNDTLLSYLNSIVLKGEDPNKKKRLLCLKDLQLTNNYCAQNIADYIDSLLS